MATLTISLSSVPVTGSKSWTASEADVNTLITYMQQKFGNIQGQSLTPAQALVAWAQDWVSKSIAEARWSQAQAAANTAAAAVPPLSFT